MPGELPEHAFRRSQKLQVPLDTKALRDLNYL